MIWDKLPNVGRDRKPTLEIVRSGRPKPDVVAPVARPDFLELGAAEWPADWLRKLDDFLELLERSGVPVRANALPFLREIVSLQIRIEVLEDDIRENGTTVPGERGGVRRNPACVELRADRKTLLSLCARFGCSPYDFERLRHTDEPLNALRPEDDDLEKRLE